jgi:hypothetical protein
MPYPLHKSPSGLLELFRLRALGKQPDQFGNAVQPVYDVGDHYAPDLYVTGRFDTAPGVMNQTLTARGSVGRYMHVSGTVVVGAAAGTFLHMRLGLQQPGGNPIAWLVQSNFTPRVAVAFTIAVPVLRMVLPAGVAFVLNTQGDAAGADHDLSIEFGFYAFTAESPF